MKNLALVELALVLLFFFAAGTARAGQPTTADCLAAYESSLKSASDHKLAAERRQLLVCASATCPKDVRKECLARVDQVNAQIPTVVFSAKDANGADLSAVKVTMDGLSMADHLDGTTFSIDPGEHTFTFESAGLPTVTKELLIVEGQKDRREIVVFGPPAEAAPLQQPTPPAGAGEPSKPSPSPAQPSESPPKGGSSSGLGSQKAVAIVVGAIGLTSVGVGSYFAFQAMSKKNDAESICPSQCSTPDGVTKWNDAVTAGNIATIGLVAGGVGIVAAAVLWLTAPGSDGGATQIGLGPGGVRVRGSW